MNKYVMPEWFVNYLEHLSEGQKKELWVYLAGSTDIKVTIDLWNSTEGIRERPSSL